MIEITPQDALELFAVGTGVSAAIALVMQKLVAPYLRMLVEPLRSVALRFAPVLLGVIFTVALFPIAALYLTPLDLDHVTWRLTVPLGIIAGAGATYAYDMWQATARRLLERWTK